MKILLFGGSGQLGCELRRSLALLGEVVAPPSGAWPEAVDFRQPQRVEHLVAQLAPQVVVNAAAYTAVDRAESEQAVAAAVNALAPRILADAANACGALLVHYSSDYVFDGTGSTPWTEADEPAPLNVYGRTKLEGERAAALAQHHLVLRSSWLYGLRGGNFVRTMLRQARDNERLTVVNDQVGAPTGCDLLADLTAHAILRTLAQPQLGGLYHVAAAGETSWHGYAGFVLQEARRLGEPLRATSVEGVGSAAYPAVARRPQNSRLDTRKFRSAFGLRLPPWQEGVARMLAHLIPAEPL
jgi:dTDP-4-dehydrorhamnose reductase